MKKKKETRGRKKIGTPISVTLTPEQEAWVDSQIEPGGTRTQAIRRIIQKAMDSFKKSGK